MDDSIEKISYECLRHEAFLKVWMSIIIIKVRYILNNELHYIMSYDLFLLNHKTNLSLYKKIQKDKNLNFLTDY